MSVYRYELADRPAVLTMIDTVNEPDALNAAALLQVFADKLVRVRNAAGVAVFERPVLEVGSNTESHNG